MSFACTFACISGSFTTHGTVEMFFDLINWLIVWSSQSQFFIFLHNQEGHKLYCECPRHYLWSPVFSVLHRRWALYMLRWQRSCWIASYCKYCYLLYIFRMINMMMLMMMMMCYRGSIVYWTWVAMLSSDCMQLHCIRLSYLSNRRLSTWSCELLTDIQCIVIIHRTWYLP